MVNSVGMTVVCYRCFVLLCLFCSVGMCFAFCGLAGCVVLAGWLLHCSGCVATLVLVTLIAVVEGFVLGACGLRLVLWFSVLIC